MRPTESEILEAARLEALRNYAPPRGLASRLIRNKREFCDIEGEAREEEAWFRHQMYTGKQAQFLDKLEGEEPEDFAQRRNKETRNLTSLITEMKGALYRRAPRRAVVMADGGELSPDAEKLNERLALVYADEHADINSVLKLADRMAYLQGLVALRPWYDQERDRVEVTLFLKHRIRIVENDDNPKDPLSVIFRWDAINAKGEGYTRAQVWTDETLQEHGPMGWGPVEPHNYGRKPVVIIRNEYPAEGFWTDGRGGPICDTNTIVNNLLTDGNHTAEYQSFAVPVMTGNTTQDVKVGPGQPLTFIQPPSGGTPGLAFVSPDWKVEQAKAHIREKIDGILEVERIPKSAVRLESGASSGIQIIAENIPLDEYREERRETFAPIERELAHVIALRIFEHSTKFNVDPRKLDWSLQVDYAEPTRPINQTEVIAKRTFNLEQGLVHPWQLWMEDNPDRYPTEDAAREAWVAHLAAKVEVMNSEPALALAEAEGGGALDFGSLLDDPDDEG